MSRAAAPGRSDRDLPPRLGITVVEGGAEFAVYAGRATSVDVCLFEEGDATGETERRIPLPHRTYGVWHGFLPGVGPGQRYGLRADGPWRPGEAVRYNPGRLLLDPYARAIEGEVTWAPEVYGHQVDVLLAGDDTTRIGGGDSASSVPRSVVVREDFDWGNDRPLRTSLANTVLYEAHVRNLTMLHPEVPEELRGTYAGLAHPAVLDHLTSLGVTAVELLPVHAFTSEPQVVQRGLANHWGYNTLGFFAPQASYASASDPQGALDEFKGMVRLLHERGLEVILDVVYNHTAEQSCDGATLSWRGLDSRCYYRVDDRGLDIDVTGCGNTLDLRQPMVARMVLDSLRYWVEECHVDGFRFDLAVALARGPADDYDRNHPFLVALRTDPVLSQAKLIAEPWDVGIHGWRTGQFPPPFAEWNDRFRDAVRTFWLPDLGSDEAGESGHGVRELATRLAGSQDVFGPGDRTPLASVNFVAAHDGFTTADLTRYNSKHNGANGEGNRDGSDNNQSWNHGTEGRADDETLEVRRRRTMRNLLGTLLLSTGVPMLNAGDEFGRSQNGNNNTYCQDNALSWFQWDLAPWQEDLLATTRFLTELRRTHPMVRQRSFFTGREMPDDDGSNDLAWFDATGAPMSNGAWEHGHTRTLQMLLNGNDLDERSVLLVFHAGVGEVEIGLPSTPGVKRWELLWDSTDERPRAVGPAVKPGPTTLGPSAIRVYRSAASR